jgi:hypothetical protein
MVGGTPHIPPLECGGAVIVPPDPPLPPPPPPLPEGAVVLTDITGGNDRVVTDVKREAIIGVGTLW